MPLNLEKVKRGPGGAGAGVAPGGGSRVTSGEGGVAPDDLFAAWVAGPAEILAKSSRAGVQAVLFDLDGVLVETAAFHFEAWKRLADELGLPFDERINHGFRGVGRTECLEKLLGRYAREFAGEEKRLLGERKNGYYLERVKSLRPADLAPGARTLAMRLRAGGIRMALVSASRNARLVVKLLGIDDWFDAIVDGDSVKKGKPEPDGFLLAARKMRVEAEHCVVIEDAEAGIKAGHAAEMVCVGIGKSASEADVVVDGVGELTVEMLERAWEEDRHSEC